MVASYDIGQISESKVVNLLRINSWKVNWDIEEPGSPDIYAISEDGKKSILVQVKAAIFPNNPAYLTREEEMSIKSKAKELGAKAHLAFMQLSQELELVGKISLVELV